MKKVLFFASVALLAFSSCKKDNNEKKEERVFKSEVKPFQHGKAWTWYEEDAAKNPLRLAIAFDDAAFNSLDRSTDGESSGHHHENSLSLKLHPKALAATPFQHALLDWMPSGHQPFFGEAHFDFHFYMTSEAERTAIPPYEVDPSKFLKVPTAEYMPANYIAVPGGVPQMGTHWVDVTSPALNGGLFKETFIFGTYDSKVTFYEPMITEQFIRDNQSFERAIPQPAKYQIAGWHPTKMRIEKKDGVTSFILEGFVKRQAL
jgi:hypothetical protein